MDAFKNNIKSWVSLDNHIQELNSQLKQLREEKKQITHDLYSFANENNYETSTIKISDGSLKFNTHKVVKPISMNYILSCLESCREDTNLDDDAIQIIMETIKTSREYSLQYDVKRIKKKDL